MNNRHLEAIQKVERNIYIENHPLEQARILFIEKLEEAGFFKNETEEIPVREAYGRISAEAVFARRSSPHYTASAMDGIAVASRDTVAANETRPVTLSPGQYLEVDTGDYVPREFDSVVMIEDVNFMDGGARIIKPAVPWQHIRSVGEDLVAHDMIVPSFTRLGPYEIASFITAAVENVAVVKKPLVAIIPTGTELVEPGTLKIEPGQIVESNSYMLSGMAREWGAEVVRHPIVPDRRDLLKAALLEAVETADVIVMCSGSSAGREDYTAGLVAEMGELLVHGLAVRPGKPAILGIIKNKPVIGVPGYPVSAQLIFTLFARPVLCKKQGIPEPEAEKLEAVLSKKTASHMGVDEFLYVNVAPVRDKYVAYPLSRGAGITTSLVKADGTVLVPRSQEGFQAGEKCTVSLLRGRSCIDKTLVSIGSHDLSIDFLADLLVREYGLRLVSTNAGSMGGLMALARQESHMAGLHLLDPGDGEYNISYLKRYLSKQSWLLINIACRQQGLMVKKGNPLGLRSLADLADNKIRYINRQKGSGTRVLLDHILSREGIPADEINGYNREEYTHLAVAAAVKSDACDAGLGIYASARAMDLDFIPIAEETYDLCVLPDLIQTDCLDSLIKIIKSPAFHALLTEAGGYRLDLTGQIRSSSVL